MVLRISLVSTFPVHIPHDHLNIAAQTHANGYYYP